MKRSLCLLLLLFLPVSVILALSAAALDSSEVRELFRNPPREYSTGPLWVWNDLLTDGQIRSTLTDLARQQVKQVWVHPRPGLMTPYLSSEWFHLWDVALNEARRLDMNVWIYDENSYPSGFAGGWVPELLPESRGRGLKLTATQAAPAWSSNTLAVLRVHDGRSEDVSSQVKAGERLPEGNYRVATLLRAPDRAWTADHPYVDLLYPGAAAKFLEVTHEAYRKHLGAEFGKRIPGSFTDEPEIRSTDGMPWTEDLPLQFEKRWGYDLIERLPALTDEIGDWRQVRHNYYSTLNDLFIERWAQPYFRYCSENHLESTGHYWEHEWPVCSGVPDNMAMAAWQHRPGIDILMNQYSENTHAQFGNVRSCREIASLGNQLGRRTLVEVYGAGGWDLRFEDMKRIGDWLQVLGVNTLNQHLSYVTLRGARKRDHPQSFSYHEPWWDAYHVSAGYLARLSAALSQGEQINRILVLEPTTTAWMYQGNRAKLRELGGAFSKLLMALESDQIEYDLGSEDVIKRHGGVQDGRFRVGRRGYKIVVIPPHTENLDVRVADLCTQFLNSGGRILCLDKPPSRINGKSSGQLSQIASQRGWTTAPPQNASALLQEGTRTQEFQITRTAGDRGILFHMRRQFADGELLFLVNSSSAFDTSGSISTRRRGIEKWDPYSGSVTPHFFEASNGGSTARFALPPGGSLLLFLSDAPLSPGPRPGGKIAPLPPAGRLLVERLEPNVLTLDYVDVTAGGETRSDLYFYQASQFAFQKNGLERNPWDSAVQFKDNLVKMTFPADSGFTVSYKFTLTEAIPDALAIVIERPDLYTMTCNGRPLPPPVALPATLWKSDRTHPISSGNIKASPEFKEWWLDKAFAKISLAGLARVGENIVTLRASPFTLSHEIEPAYLLGNFTLMKSDQGFLVAPDEPLQIKISPSTGAYVHASSPDGTMWLSNGIRGNPRDDDRAPFLVLDLGSKRDVTLLRVWNYLEPDVRTRSSRGAKAIRLTASVDFTNPQFDQPLGQFELHPGEQHDGPSDELPIDARGIRLIRMEILSNQNGVAFPAIGEPADDGFVGLAEIEAIGPDGRRIDGIGIRQVSSERTSKDRRARHLVDGSGLPARVSRGWDAQGHPFYSAGVAYRQTFSITQRAGRYFVALGKWLGSVARVSVNGTLAGYIDAAPFECDVTQHLRNGDNQVEVVVIGTLRNTLGPHHGEQPLGSAWPTMFQKAPNPGPPPGAEYSTVGYGLFEPFRLEQRFPQG